MDFRQIHHILVIMACFNFQYVSGECPLIYQMIDQQHSYCATQLSLHSLPPTDKEIVLILEIHNKERSDVNAEHMQKMYWNKDLANIAQRYADHCHYDHDKANQRQAPRIPLSTGQNLAMGYKDWTSVVRAWTDEKKHFVYGSHTQHGVVGHYTQMVKDTAALVGCGLATCPKSHVNPHRDWPHYVSNYVTGQLGDNKPYIPAQSSQSNNKQLRDCRGLVCLYGGTMNLDSCQCQCQSHASGKQCENLDCSSLSDGCNYGNDKSLCTKYTNVPNECPKFCGLCDRYDEMKKYYDSLDSGTNTGSGTIDGTQSGSSTVNLSISLVYIQLIIVSFVLLLI